MGAASASSQSSAMPQSQGKGGGAPTGGSGAPMSGGKGFSNQQPYSPEGGYHNQGPTIGQSANQTQSDMGSTISTNQLSELINPSQTPTGQSTQANTQPLVQGAGKGGSAQGSPQSGPQLPTESQQGWQYGQGAGDRVTYPTTSGQQQFGQPMQGSTGSAAYSNTIGQQSNQSSGKGKGA